MLYAVLCYNDEKTIAAWPKDQDDKVMADLAAVQSKMAANSRLGPVARLKPTTAATTVRKTKGKPVVLDGPFAETKEQFLGFYVIDCATMDEALEFAHQLAEANPGAGGFEIRPVDVYFPSTIAAA